MYLEVRPTGSKIWRYRYWKADGKDGIFTIGKYPSVTLAEARKSKDWASIQVSKGLNPTDAVKAVEAENTFKTIAEEWLKQKSRKNAEKTMKNKEGILRYHAYPAFGSKLVKDIKPIDVLRVMQKLENAGNLFTAIH